MGGAFVSFCSKPGGRNSPEATIPESMSPRTNWAGNLTYSAAQLHTPGSIEELQELVRASEKIRALGTNHCFNTIAEIGRASCRERV